MAQLEDLKPNALVQGILPNGLVSVVNVQWHGSAALELTYKTPEGKVANELLYRHDEPRIEVVERGRPWSFDGDGRLFRLVAEAQRIRLLRKVLPIGRRDTAIGNFHQSRFGCAGKRTIGRKRERRRMSRQQMPLWFGDAESFCFLVKRLTS